MTEYFDSLETRDPEERERALLAALPGQIAHAKANAPGFARILAEVEPRAVTSRAALARLPVTRKSDLGELQKRELPLGGLNATPLDKLAKIFVSPGPVYEPEGTAPDWWRTARALFSAGFRPGSLVINTFAYHFTPAGSMLRIGCARARLHRGPRPESARRKCRFRPSPICASAALSGPRLSSS